MFALILGRLGAAWITLLVIAVVVFVGVELMPGDACTALLGRDAVRVEVLENCRDRMGLNRSPVERFFAWAGDLAQGDLGVSMKRERPIVDIVGPRLRNTLILAVAAALAGVPLAIGLGVMVALRRERPFDIIVSTTALVAMTMPEFVVASLLILIFAIWLGWSAGVVTAAYDAPALTLLFATPLPAVTLALVYVAHILRMVRSSVIDTAGADFILMARMKGVPERRIVRRHLLPNAILPTIPVIGLTLAWLLSGVVIVESAFNYPGIGRLAVNAVADRDLPLVQAITLIFGLIYVSMTLIADLLAMALNPRLRTRRL
ncbi:MAG: ABC transporter permease [Rhodobacterales bacterium]|nr:ABC transporter permease [Rhodobacterales bacterium]